MSAPKTPPKQAVLPLTDPNHVEETYANNLAGIRIQGDHVHLTLSVIRALHDPAHPRDENVVSSRQVWPVALLNALNGALEQLARAQAMQQPPSSKPN